MEVNIKIPSLEFNPELIESDINYLYQKLSTLNLPQYKHFIERFVDDYEQFSKKISSLLEALSNNESITNNQNLSLLLKEYYHLLLEFNNYFTPEDETLETALNNVLVYLIKSNRAESSPTIQAA